MFKLTYLVARRSDLSTSEFEALWHNNHADLVASKAEDLGAIRYTMSLRTKCSRDACLSHSRGYEPASFDGLIEIWWPDRASYDAKLGRPDGLATFDALATAERAFMDIEKSKAFFTEETIIFDTTEPNSNTQRDCKGQLLSETR